jgi:DNA-binding MarR family transcriptional regulator
MSDSDPAAGVLFRALLPVEQSMGLSLLLALAAVAREPGLSVNALADRLGVPQQTASRYVASLQGRYETPGRHLGPLPLLAIDVSAADPRKRSLSLTAAGRARLEEVLAGLRDPPEET